MSQQDTTTSDLTGIISNNPLQAFDLVIQQSRCQNSAPAVPHRFKNLALSCILALAGRHIFEDDKNVEKEALNLLDDYKEVDQKKLLAVCFLRLLPEPAMKWVSDNPFRPKVIGLLDSQFNDVISQEKKEEIKLAHQKIERLAEIVKDQEQSFLTSLQMLTSLECLRTHREKLMKSLKSRWGGILMPSFLPNTIEAQLSEIYKRVEVYIEQRNNLGVVDARAKATEEIEHLVQTLNAKSTLYSQQLSEQVGKKLLTLIEEDFATNKVAQPATVSVKVLDKKYPFHLAGETVNLGFIVKNQGPGYAYDTKVTILGDESIRLLTEQVEIGTFASNTTQLVEIPAEVIQTGEQVYINLQVSWRNFDSTQHNPFLEFYAKAQRSDIDWEQLKHCEPYSLNHVTNEQELAGRRDILNRLIGIAKAPSVGSSIIDGQKRVGKTSIATALKSYLERLGYLVVALEGGDFVEPSAKNTIARLGNLLCKEINKKLKQLDPKLADISIPKFDEALSPFKEFIDEIEAIIQDKSLVIILDEFDELPLETYARSDFGNAFFLTLRSISSRRNVGFVLVGGEKMVYIRECQGKHLNKWDVFRVDYFTRESDWTDYRELVERPVADTLEYTEDALVALHNNTAGNPYFTKLVCQYVFETAVERRDCHITRTEIEKAIEKAASADKTDIITFAHFWEDGIFETGEPATVKSIRRRKILIALSDVLAKQSPASESMIVEHTLVRDIASVASDLREFVARKVLVTGIQDNTYDFKVRLFHKWLKGRGVCDLIATFSDLNATLRQRQQEERLKVQSQEIVTLVKKWGMYKGQSITEDKVRVWLEQFTEIREQRLMFDVLKGLRFYSSDFVRQKMREAHGIVTRNLTRNLPPKESGKRKQSDILVSYLDGAAKSGAESANLYVDEASLYVDNLVEKGNLKEKLLASKAAKALVFIDDFVGTGESASKYLSEIDATIAEIVQERQIKVVFVALVAFVEGWKRVEEAVDNLSMHIHTHRCELLDETAQYFSDKSSVFTDINQRELARQVALRVGKELVKKFPLGYGNIEMAVVFERGCPNNSLPILWAESTNPKWTPLFKRL